MQIKSIKKKKISKNTKIIAFFLLAPWTLVGMASAYMFIPDTAPITAGENESNKLVVVQKDVQNKLVSSESEPVVSVHFFGQDKCGYCREEKEFIEEYLISEPNVRLIYYNVAENEEHGLLFGRLTQANDLPRVTPYTFVGGEIIKGFGGEETTGKQIKEAIEYAKDGHDYDIEDYLNFENIAKNNFDSTQQATSSEGVLYDVNGFELRLPVFGVIDIEGVSLFSLSVILGLVDGFNPCALWVLMAFLLILMQIGNRKKMFYVAGLFIFAESIMYYLILNIWYKTWDFVGLDNIVTPLVGVFAIGCGIYFLYKYNKTKNKFTCDVTSIEKQSKIQNKIHKLVSSPMTLATVIGILGVALSVNVIEFACSIGIPQAFTKILEINALEFWAQQWYLMIYIFAYMVDDFVVFGFALYGFDKLHASEKYSKLSILVGGILMILLGGLLLFAPGILMF
ncbi:MAG: glutaredoxin [Candidatus Pacebacteria bacterium]|nr:glutaredoxin [Candidatus Paceibacterota bacterium]